MTTRGPSRRAALLAAGVATLACLVGLVSWFPARLALRLLPAPWSCPSPGGTLWQGQCDDLLRGEASAGAVSWHLQALPLLRARLVAELRWSQRGSRLTAMVEAARDKFEVRALRGDADLATLRALPSWPPALVAAWPPVDGRLRPDISALTLRGGRLVGIAGVVDADGLVAAGRERWMLGDHRITWRAPDAADVIAGDIEDRGGPVELRAQLQRRSLPAGDVWRLTGTARARDAAWRPRLLALGPVDDAGRHVVSLEWR